MVFLVGVAQLVRALGCGPGGREFESLHPPQIITESGIKPLFLYLTYG